MKKEWMYASLIASILFVFGCAQIAETDVEDNVEGKAMVEDKSMAADKESGELILFAGTASKYYRFDKAHYENSLEEGKIIFLDFHADWCPVCAKERPSILAAFTELNNADVVGYQVHYNDKATNADDEEMAKKYGITYQYTKVILDKEGNIALKTLEILDKGRIIDELRSLSGE